MEASISSVAHGALSSDNEQNSDRHLLRESGESSKELLSMQRDSI
jgi:hypothetical protein